MQPFAPPASPIYAADSGGPGSGGPGSGGPGSREARSGAAIFQQALALHRAGRLAEAEQLYRQAIARQPNHAESLFYLGVLLNQSGRPGLALPLLQGAVAARPRFVEAHCELGVCQQNLGRPDLALEAFRQAVRQKPKAVEAQAYLGMTYQQLGQAEAAVKHLRQALKLKPGQPQVRVYLGNALVQLGRHDEALRHFDKALEVGPTDPGIHVNLGNVWQELGQNQRAIAAYRSALALDARLAAAHHGLAAVHQRLGQLPEAVAHYEKAAAQTPSPAVFASLAAVLERAHRFEEATRWADKALALDAGHPEAGLIRAKIARRGGAADVARRAYETLIEALDGKARGDELTILARAQSDLASLCESAGEHAAAMRLFAAANRHNCETNPQWKAQTEAYLARVKEAERGLAALPSPVGAAALQEAGPGQGSDPPTPVFMVGFPRSGTTLLDQLLHAHSAVAVMEEKTVVDELRAQFPQSDEALPAALAGLPAARRDALRQDYWRRAEAYGATAPGGGLLIDKLPLNLLNLGLVNAVFPEARVLFSLRDPRDVCLSCFTNLFRMGEGLAGFPTLQDSATLYAAVMRLWQRQQAVLPLAVHQVRYEDLVTDIEGEARKALAFLGLNWEPGVLDYRKTARARYIVTPSYHQVVEPLYKSSIGRWRHYQDELAGVLPILAPFVAAFGYQQANN